MQTGFRVNTGQTVSQTIPASGFWPELKLAEFMELYRLPSEYAENLLLDHLALARLWAVKELEAWQAEQTAAGYATLEAVPLYGLPAEEGVTLRLYKRAVFCQAKALLLAQFATLERREAARNDAKEAPESADRFLAWAHQAIAALKGVTHINVALI